MTSWRDVEAAEPQFAARVRAAFAVRKHATMATIALDGSPRISGTEVDFADDGEIYLGMMPTAHRTRDLLRDPRVSIHCPTVDPPEDDPAAWAGEAKIAARAAHQSGDDADRFRLEINRVVLTSIAADAQALEVVVWRPETGLRTIRRG